MTGSKDGMLYQAARRHYIDGATMETIAQELGVSRPTVSRLLAKARETGLVRITLAEPPTADSPTAKFLCDRFGVRMHMAAVPEPASTGARFKAVARTAAHLLASVVEDGMSLGIAWGTTAVGIAKELEHSPRDEVRVVQMNGAGHARSSAIPYSGTLLNTYAQAFGDAEVIPFPVPAFFDYASTREALWRERSIRRVRETIWDLDVALFGIGYPAGKVPSHVYATGYIEAHELAELLRGGVVGDVCTVMLRADGSYADIPINQRASGPNPAEMQSIRRRIGVVGDPSRATAVLAALRAGTMTDLVCDPMTARAVMKLEQPDQ